MSGPRGCPDGRTIGGTNGGLVGRARGRMVSRMKTKRLLAAVLWFFTSWYAWNFLAEVTGLPFVLGPVVGLLAALAIVGLWGQRWSVPAPAAAPAIQPES